MGFCGSILCNLPAATRLPKRVIAPTAKAKDAVMVENKSNPLPIPAIAKPPTNALAAPPKPLSKATIWGISIIFTFVARIKPKIAPSARPIYIDHAPPILL